MRCLSTQHLCGNCMGIVHDCFNLFKFVVVKLMQGIWLGINNSINNWLAKLMMFVHTRLAKDRWNTSV